MDDASKLLLLSTISKPDASLYLVERLLNSPGFEINDPIEGNTPLSRLMKQRNVRVAVFRLMFKAGAKADNSTELPQILRAIDGHDIELVKVFIENGADLNRKFSRKFGNEYILSYAARFGTPQIAQLLMDNGADAIEMNRKDCSPYEWAMANSSWESMCQVFFRAGVPIDNLGLDTAPALYFAARHESEHVFYSGSSITVRMLTGSGTVFPPPRTPGETSHIRLR
jgi:ankyrin repeat protein